MSRLTRTDLRARLRVAPARALVRRLRIAASKGVLWLLEGGEDFDGNVERDEIETFPGVGFYARPKRGDRAEAVVVKVGGEDGHPVIVATRNQDGIKRLGELAEDETAIFTSKSVVRIKADGTVEIGSIGGAVQPTIKATSYRAAEDALFTAIAALGTAVNGEPAVGGTLKGAGSALATAVATFQSSAASYLTTKLRGE